MRIIPIIALLLAVSLPWPCARAQTPANQGLKVEVLSLSVTKMTRDAFGNAVNPFGGTTFGQSSGTAVLAKITPADAATMSLQESRCRLMSFKDDRGTDLAGTNAVRQLGDPVFSMNRPFEILRSRDGEFFGIQLRSGLTPAPAANRLTAEVLLAFGRSSDEQLAQQAGVELQPERTFVVGPVKFEFSILPPHPKQTKPAAEQWLATFQPDSDVAVSSVTILSETEDTPLLLVKNLKPGGESSYASTGTYRGTATGKPIAYGFKPPANRRAILKVRYFKADALVEQRCVITTGVGP